MIAIILLATTKTLEVGNTLGYVFGVVIALLILGYLMYSLIKPEKF